MIVDKTIVKRKKQEVKNKEKKTKTEQI